MKIIILLFLSTFSLLAEKLPRGVFTVAQLPEAFEKAKAEQKPIAFLWGDLTTH